MIDPPRFRPAGKYPVNSPKSFTSCSSGQLFQEHNPIPSRIDVSPPEISSMGYILASCLLVIKSFFAVVI